jgi:hypothetical protein
VNDDDQTPLWLVVLMIVVLITITVYAINAN